MKIFSIHHADGITKFVLNGKDFPCISNVVFGEGVRGLWETLLFKIGHLSYSFSISYKKASPQLDISSY